MYMYILTGIFTSLLFCHWSLKGKVQGSSPGPTWPDLKLATFFPLGPRWQMRLEHCATYYMLPTTAYMYTCLHVGKYVSYLPKVRFPPGPPVSYANNKKKLWPYMLKVALNTNQSNQIFAVLHTCTCEL